MTHALLEGIKMTGQSHSGSIVTPRQASIDQRNRSKKACRDGRQKNRFRLVSAAPTASAEEVNVQRCERLFWKLRKYCYKAFEKLDIRSPIKLCQHLDALKSEQGVTAAQLLEEEKYDEVKDLILNSPVSAN